MDETGLGQDEVDDLLGGDERDAGRTRSTSGSGERARGPATVTLEAATGYPRSRELPPRRTAGQISRSRDAPTGKVRLSGNRSSFRLRFAVIDRSG